MKNIDDYKLTDSVTVGQLKSWIASKDQPAKKHIIKLIDHRFTNRYLIHAESIDSGFLKMAISCLTIETLESFKQGLKDTNKMSRKMFKDFFASETTHFSGFDLISIDFYENIRCGILHQAETTNAWRISRTGPLLNTTEKVINAKLFVIALRKSTADYISKLENEDINSSTWKSAILKLEDICDNCSVTKTYP